MANLKSILKQKYSNKTLNEFDEIESAPTDYDKERRQGRRASRMEDSRADSRTAKAKSDKAFSDVTKKIGEKFSEKRKAKRIAANKAKEAAKKEKYSTPKDIIKMSKDAGSEPHGTKGEVSIPRGTVKPRRAVKGLSKAQDKMEQRSEQMSAGRDSAVELQKGKMQSGLELAPMGRKDLDKPAIDAHKKGMAADKLKKAIQKKYNLNKR